MAGEGRLDRDLRRLQIADLTHHDDVGVLAHDVAQACRKREPDIRVHGYLVHPRQLILDGILDGDDLLVGRVDLVEGGVEGSGLARSRRSRH